MANQSTSFLAAANGGGWHPLIVGKHELLHTPAEMHFAYDISVSGLDGGTWAILYYPVHAPNAAISIKAALTEEDAQTLGRVPLASAFRFVFSDTGAGAAPRVGITYAPER